MREVEEEGLPKRPSYWHRGWDLGEHLHLVYFCIVLLFEPFLNVQFYSIKYIHVVVQPYISFL